MCLRVYVAWDLVLVVAFLFVFFIVWLVYGVFFIVGIVFWFCFLGVCMVCCVTWLLFACLLFDFSCFVVLGLILLYAFGNFSVVGFG